MANPRMTGIWRGEVGDFKYCLDLIQVKDHVNGTLHVGGFERTGSITGGNYYPEVALSGFFLKVGAAFNGHFVDDNTITGKLRYLDDVEDFTFRRDSSCKVCR